MSRTYRRWAAGGNTTSHSEKDNKLIWHRAYRRVHRQKLLYAYKKEKLEDYLYILPREMFNVWSFNKDGKGLYYLSETDLLKKTFSLLQSYANCCYQYDNLDETRPWGLKYSIEDITEWLEYESGLFEFRLGFWDIWEYITEDQIREYARQKYKSNLGKDHGFWLKRGRNERN
jgi:hypothetical protein